MTEEIKITQDMVGGTIVVRRPRDQPNPAPPALVPRELPWSPNDVWDIIQDDLIAHERSMGMLDYEAFYNGSYTALALNSLYKATGDRRYLERFKAWFGAVRNGATITRPPETAICGTGGPRVEYGATSREYQYWPKCPHVKSQRQWAMTVMAFLFDILSGRIVATDQDKSWASDAYWFVHKNIVERWICNNGAFGAGLINIVKSARDREYIDSKKVGYWGSQAALGIATLLMDDQIRNLIDPDTQFEYQRKLQVDYDEWFTWWFDAIAYNDDGTLEWDTNNPNINAHGSGWGLDGEHKAPATAHSSRYIYLCQLMLDTGLHPSLRDAPMRRMGATVAKRICLPLDYVTPDGDHAGQVAGVQQMANYIDGNNSHFRASWRGMHNQANSNAGMEAFMYQGWYLGAVYNDEAFDAMIRLHDLVRGPKIPPSDKRHTGTYSRHYSVYGRVGLWAAICDINCRRKKNLEP